MPGKNAAPANNPDVAKADPDDSDYDCGGDAEGEDDNSRLKGLCKNALTQYQEGLMFEALQAINSISLDSDTTANDKNGGIPDDGNSKQLDAAGDNSDDDDIMDVTDITFLIGDGESGPAFDAFANIISSFESSKWRTELLPLILSGISAFELKGRERGSIHDAQKAKSLQSRWFEKKDKKSTAESQPSKESNFIKRDRVVTVPVEKPISGTMQQKDKVYIVMAVFNKFYRKWNMTRDTPAWSAGAKKSSYRLSIRRVEYDETFSRYNFVKVSKEEPRGDIFRIIDLHEVTSIVS